MNHKIQNFVRPSKALNYGDAPRDEAAKRFAQTPEEKESIARDATIREIENRAAQQEAMRRIHGSTPKETP